MEEKLELKRPWSIKFFVVVVGLLFTIGLITSLFDLSKPWKLIYNLIILVSIFGVWQGRVWARNIFFILTLPYILFFGLGSGATLLNVHSNQNLWYQFYIAIAMISIVFLFLMTFLKPSRHWFNTVNGNKSEKKSAELSWQFQLMIILTAMVCSALGPSITPSLLPLAKEFMLNFSTYYSRFAILIAFESLSFFIGNMAILFPFSVSIGYWKKGNIAILTRLITIGSIFILLLFPVGETVFVFSGFFISKVIVIACTAYLGLILGKKLSDYVVKLKQLKAIPS